MNLYSFLLFFFFFFFFFFVVFLQLLIFEHLHLSKLFHAFVCILLDYVFFTPAEGHRLFVAETLRITVLTMVIARGNSSDNDYVTSLGLESNMSFKT